MTCASRNTPSNSTEPIESHVKSGDYIARLAQTSLLTSVKPHSQPVCALCTQTSGQLTSKARLTWCLSLRCFSAWAQRIVNQQSAFQLFVLQQLFLQLLTRFCFGSIVAEERKVLRDTQQRPGLPACLPDVVFLLVQRLLHLPAHHLLLSGLHRRWSCSSLKAQQECRQTLETRGRVKGKSVTKSPWGKRRQNTLGIRREKEVQSSLGRQAGQSQEGAQRTLTFDQSAELLILFTPAGLAHETRSQCWQLCNRSVKRLLALPRRARLER